MTLRSMWKSVATNPANEGRTTRQFAHAIAFQLRWRTFHMATKTRIGGHSFMWAHGDSWGSKAVVYGNPPDVEMFKWSTALSPGDLFVDIGANVGCYTLWALDLGAQVVAFEPDRLARERLERNLDLNGYAAEIVPAAASDSLGRAFFTQGKDTMNSLAEAGVGRVEVPTTTLDAVLGRRYAAGVKIDVEGHERRVLEGARQALADRRIELLQLEWNDSCESALGESRAPIAEMLEGYGYRLFRVDGTPVLGDVYGPDVFASRHA